MVNARPSAYKCSECGKDYDYEREADSCCEKKVKDWTDVNVFELKQIHLDLLKQVAIGWDDCEFGAPCIDCKRPYGNSDVLDDMAEIIKLQKKDHWDFDEESWDEKTTDYLIDLHKQTQVALEIVLHCQSFKLGKYKKKDYQDWEFVK